MTERQPVIDGISIPRTNLDSIANAFGFVSDAETVEFALGIARTMSRRELEHQRKTEFAHATLRDYARTVRNNIRQRRRARVENG